MKNNLLYIIFCLVILFTYCKKAEELEFKNKQNDILNVFFSDTTNIVSYSVKEDPSKINTTKTANNLLGTYNDAIFGKTTSSFCSQFRLNLDNFSFGTNPVCDTIILYLAYNNHYGEINAIQNINVYEMDEVLSDTVRYYSNHDVKYKSLSIGNRIVNPGTITDTVKGIDGTKYVPYSIAITLDKNFGNKIINADVSNYLTTASFTKFFQGIYITSITDITNKGAILYFDLSKSKICIRYHNSIGAGQIESLITKRTGSSEDVARFNIFTHDYTSANSSLTAQINKTDTLAGNNFTYLQAMAGIKVKISLPDFKNLKNIAINRADLIIKVDQTIASNLINTPPKSLALYAIKKDMTTYLIDYGVTYNSQLKQYNFNLTRYLQDYLTNNLTDKGFYLVIDNSSSIAANVILSGSKNKVSDNMKIVVKYTNL